MQAKGQARARPGLWEGESWGDTAQTGAAEGRGGVLSAGRGWGVKGRGGSLRAGSTSCPGHGPCFSCGGHRGAGEPGPPASPPRELAGLPAALRPQLAQEVLALPGLLLPPLLQEPPRGPQLPLALGQLLVEPGGRCLGGLQPPAQLLPARGSVA